MVPVKRADGTTVQYVVEPMLNYRVKRITANEHAHIEEDILRASSIDDARQTARALTDYERAHPSDGFAKVLDFGDVEVH